MKLFEQQDDAGVRRKSKTAKLLRRMNHKRERAAANRDPEFPSSYNRYHGYAL